MKVKALKNGPYIVEIKGKIKVIKGGKEEEMDAKVLALCRCGHSNNKPFCDGSHAKVGFQAEEVEVEAE